MPDTSSYCHLTNIMRHFLVILPTAIWLAGCALLGTDDGPPDLSLEELGAAPSLVTIDGKVLSLETYMWRDFMPMAPPAGRALVAILRVRTDDGSAIPDGLRMPAAWIVNDRQVWGTFLEDEQPEPHPDDALELVARNGPKWGPHIEVDVVVRIQESNGALHLLRAAGQPIDRTD